jgi:hypothetical protein
MMRARSASIRRAWDVASTTALVENQLSLVTTTDSGRSSATVHARSGARLRQTAIALAAGRV